MWWTCVSPEVYIRRSARPCAPVAHGVVSGVVMELHVDWDWFAKFLRVNAVYAASTLSTTWQMDSEAIAQPYFIAISI